MYTTHCEEPNCKKCRDLRRTTEATSEVVKMAGNKQSETPKVKSPEEENQNKILRTVTQSLAKDLLAAEDEKEFYLESFKKVKDEIHNHIGRLMEVLRKREQELCHQVEKACREEMEKIHLLTTVQCFDKLLKKDVIDRTPFRSKMVFKSEFDYILSELEKFGQLTFEAKRNTEGSNLKLLADDVAPSTLLLDNPFESTIMSENKDKYQKLAKKLEENLLYMESLAPLRKDGLKRLDDLKILSDLQQCARKTEKLKILTNVQDDAVQQSEETLDSVHFNEVDKDNSMSLPPTIANEYTGRLAEQLEKFNKIVKDEVQQFGETSGALPSTDAGKDSSKLYENRETLRRLQKSLLHMKIDCMTGFKNDTDVLMDEKLENLCKSIKRDKSQLEKIKIPARRAKYGKDNSSDDDDDDLEIISRSEAATIPSELPALPPKNRFRFGRKRSWCPSLYSKKPAVPKETQSEIEQPTQEIKPSEMIDAFLSNQHEMHDGESVQESSSRWLFNPKNCERKDVPPFTEQESSSRSSNTESQGHDPSGALRSSFKKYLEKNPEDEWLVSEKSSEQSPSAVNSCIFNREVPFLVENLDQWLSAKQKQNLVSDWLYTSQI